MKFPYVVLDIEASKRPCFKPWHTGAFLSSVGIEFPDFTSKTWFFNPLVGDEKKNLQEIVEILSNTEELVGHNIKYDLLWLLHLNLHIPPRVYCTMIGEYLLKGQQATGELSLNSVASFYGEGQKVDGMHEWWERGVNTDKIPISLHQAYLKQDVALTHLIYLKQKERILKFGLKPVADLTMAMTPILAQVELTGAPFSKDKAVHFLEEAKASTAKSNQRLQDIIGIEFNPSSSTQLQAVLYGGTFQRDAVETYEVTLKSGIVKTKTRKIKENVVCPGVGFECPSSGISKKTGKPSVNKKLIASFKCKNKQQEEIKELLLQRSLTEKMVSTIAGQNGDKGWLSVLSDDNRLHGNFNQTFTKTGRLSSSDPNMQNLPRSGTSPLKTVFEAPPGKVIINADLAQIEWRGAVELSRDQTMLDELLHDFNIHSDNAVKFLGANAEDEHSSDENIRKKFKQIRTTAKLCSFRLLYGGSAYGFYMSPDMPNYPLKKWEYFVDGFYEKYPRLKEWHAEMQAKAFEQGYLRTPSGRFMHYGDVDFSDDKQVKEWKRQVCNYSVQSFCADMLNAACVEIIRILKLLKIDAKLILLVHDSLVFECDEKDAKIVIKVCSETFKHIPDLIEQRFGYKIITPIFGDCEIGFNYGDTKEVTEDTVEEVLAKLRNKDN